MSAGAAGQPTPPRLRVIVGADSARRQFDFNGPFRIGRQDDCAVCIKDEFVSRWHAEGVFENGQWLLRDLNSANGLFVDGVRVPVVAVTHEVAVRLGVEGPFVSLEVEQPPPAPPAPPVEAAQPAPPAPPGSETMMARYVDRYFGDVPEGQPVGEHTAMIRRAFQQVQTRQKRKYGWIIAALGLAIAIAAGYALYLHRQVARQKAMAEDIFYAMKSVDLDIANVERLITGSNSPQGVEEVRRYQARRVEMQKSYDQFLSTLRVYDPKMTEQRRLILRIARIFGECELAMPPDFVVEVESYIQKWRSSGRWARDIRTARENGIIERVSRELLARDLPPEFFYLAMQESDFDPYISGPETRKGIAKGMWQFIPQTAVKYGLRLGPLADFRRPDPGDDRHHWDRETVAATSYLKDLYSSDAQASGLLVMACYNWGEDYVLPLVRALPANPRDRNFWRLVAVDGQKIPKETHDYVFYIVSAAVIGENPRLFGFDFDNPLAR